MYHQVLLKLADGKVKTAQQLIQQLKIKATELERAINLLSNYGICWKQSHLGHYQLYEPIELLDESCILEGLSKETRQSLSQLKIFSVIESTNQYALTHHLASPWACLAEYQTVGRGRQGRQWFSPYASGLCLSIKQSYQILNHALTGLNIALAITVAQVLYRLGVKDVGIKWPNDILWRGRKLAGLLLESRSQDSMLEVVIGLGMNIKVPQEMTIDSQWVDLQIILGSSVSRNVLAAQLIDHCLQTLMLYPQVGLNAFMSDWHHFDLSYGQPVRLKESSQFNDRLKKNGINGFNSNEWIFGTAWGIDTQGALLLQVGNQQRRYAYGEVSLRL